MSCEVDFGTNQCKLVFRAAITPASMSSCDDLLSKSAEQWRSAVNADFLDKCKDGTLPPEAFATWLVQVGVASNTRGDVLDGLLVRHACTPTCASS